MQVYVGTVSRKTRGKGGGAQGAGKGEKKESILKLIQLCQHQISTFIPNYTIIKASIPHILGIECRWEVQKGELSIDVIFMNQLFKGQGESTRRPSFLNGCSARASATEDFVADVLNIKYV